MQRTLCLVGLITFATIGAGCSSGPSFGEPVAPTSAQMSAVTQGDGMGDKLQPTKILASANEVLSIYGTMAGIGGSAVDPNGKKTAKLTLEPSDFPAACVSGDSTVGYTYTNCMSESVTYNGSVKASGGTVTIDLKITTAGQANTTTTLSGTVTATATSVIGDLDYNIKVDLGIGGLGGLGGVGDVGNFSTHVNYNLTNISASPRCITEGSMQVDYTAAGQSHSALFEWTGCGMFTVRNS